MTAAELLDVVALRLLCDRYAMAVDRGDGAMFADQFTSDGLLIAPRGRFRGREALEGVPAMMRRLYDCTQHNVTGLLPVFDGDRAVAQTTALAHHVYRPAGHGVEWLYQMTVRYEDAFCRTEAGWRLERRELVLVGDAAWPTGRRHDPQTREAL